MTTTEMAPRWATAHKIEWCLVDELLMEVSGGQEYTLTWAARVLGCDDRSISRFKKEGVPDIYVEDLLERANRGVVYDLAHPPARGVISGRHSRRYYKVERVPFETLLPFVEEKLGTDWKPEQAWKLFGVKRHTYYEWRRRLANERVLGVPVWRALLALEITRDQIGLGEPDAP